MPYKSTDDLPAEIKDMYSETQLERFLSAFNSAYDTCSDDGGEDGDCETSAMKEAHKAVEEDENEEERSTAKNRKSSILDRFMAEIKRIGETLFGDEPTQTEARVTSSSVIFTKLYAAVETVDPYAYINDVYFEDDGRQFAVVISEGKLFRVDYAVVEGEVVAQEWQEVEIDFPPVSRTTVHRQKNGTVRWVSIACSNAINRNGQIDSGDLFRSFVAHVDAGGAYPIRQFYHAGEVFRTGQHDFVGVYEDDEQAGISLLITSGVYDDSEIAKREIAARTKDPNYWGNSIGFEPSGPPELVEIAPDITIPVYRSGKMLEESTAPETEVSSWMTSVPSLFTEERMLTERAMEAFVKLFDDDQEAADKWLAENAAERARAIKERGMITRTQEEADASETPQENLALEIDETLVVEITRALVASEDFQKTITKVDAVEKALAELKTLVEGTGQERTALDRRLRALETDEAQRRDQWQKDLPPNARQRTKVTYRPRQQRNDEGGNPPPNMSDIAQETLSRAPVRY